MTDFSLWQGRNLASLAKRHGRLGRGTAAAVVGFTALFYAGGLMLSR